MRALLVVLACSGCASILGDYEVDPALDKKDAVIDSALDTTAVVDTAIPETPASNIKSCKALGGTDGPRDLGDGVRSFCDMMRGGYTLVAMRATNSNGDAWASVPAGLRTKKLDDPNANVDRVLDIDWRVLGFNEVVYDLGVAPATMGGPPLSPTRVYFRGLDGAFQQKALLALGMFVPNPERPDCFLDMAASSITKCEEVPMPPVLEPPSSFGWVFLSKKALCYWGYKGKPGAPNCNDGMVGGGRVWVK